jgi:hypothetical protein
VISMDDLPDLLQERLARLEGGEPLEACLAGLPEDEAALLKMVAALSQIDYPERAAERVAAQRATLLRTAKERKNTMTPESKPKSRWVLPAVAASGLAALTLICLAVAIAAAGFVWLRRSPQQVALSNTPSETAVVANPQTTTLAEVRGLVKVQNESGQWVAAKAGQTLSAGKRLRTGSLSSATLVFYDGSRTQLGPDTEISIDALDARTAGPRLIQLTQWTGDSQHDVAHSDDPASIYEVRTPSGTGAAKGTSFHVLVTALFARFEVDEGAVAIVNLNVTVVVIAGQTTTVPSGEAPGEPVFHVSGEGEVLQTGSSWNIAGQVFLTDGDTVITGDPQVGDWVAVEGHLLPDGTRLADRITLLRRAEKNKFSFTGIVDAIGSETWTISGLTVHVDSLTTIENGLEVGDAVEVVGGVAQDGAFWASRISLAEDEAPGLPFEFTGVVAAMGDSSWTISGVAIAVDENTEIEAGLEEGDVVKVEGHILSDGRWLAKSMTLAEDDEENKFEIIGPVESTDPWKVAGVEFETNDATEIEEGIKVGDGVKVEGRILADGRWLADEITRVEEDQALRFEFVGKVTGTGPWVIGGLTLTTDENTQIEGEIAIGDFARVRGRILPDGSLLAEEIKRLEGDLGCLDVTAIVVNVGGGQVALNDGQTINLSDVQINGDLQPAAIIIIHLCAADEGAIVIISITVIFQMEALPTPTPTPTATTTATPTLTPTPTPTLTVTPTATPGGEAQVTLCHRPPGNPNNAHTITVGASAVQAHLAHGDTLGPCDAGNTDNNNDNGNSDDKNNKDKKDKKKNDDD